MTAVSIYDDIDPGIKKESGPVDLYGQLHIAAPSGQHAKGMMNSQRTHSSPTITSTNPYNAPHGAPRQFTQNIPPPRPVTHNLSVNRKPAQPTIINHPLNMGAPSNVPNADPSLTGIPIAHQATFRSHVLYVGGLSWWVSDADLRRVFEQFGDIIEIKVHADKVNGKSKGYGYVEYAQRDLEGAVAAKTKLHGHLVADCRICVAFASPDRFKGAEYTNTPVHIPRGRKPMHHQNSNFNQMNRGGPHNAGGIQPHLRIGGIGPATVIPTPQIGIQSALSTVTQALGGGARSLIGGQGANGLKAGQHGPNGAAVIKQENGASGALSAATGAANILSKFTNQSQLLALLSKAGGANRSRSTSRSVSDSRSRSRSRDRSKHRRRKHHKKGSRSSAERRNRDRDRERDRDRHRSDRGRGSGSDRGRDRPPRSAEERKEREGREAREGREGREHRRRRDGREHGDEKGVDGVVEEDPDREKRRHKRRHRHHRERSDRERHHRESRDRARRRGSDRSGNEDDDIPVTTTSNVTESARVSHDRKD